MAIRPGDMVFSRGGQPGVVVGRDPKTAELIVERKGERFEKARTLGYINGLEQSDRTEYSRILTEVNKHEDPAARIDELTQEINKRRDDPRNYRLTRYLESEKAYIMNMANIHPNVYRISEDEIS